MHNTNHSTARKQRLSKIKSKKKQAVQKSSSSSSSPATKTTPSDVNQRRPKLKPKQQGASSPESSSSSLISQFQQLSSSSSSSQLLSSWDPHPTVAGRFDFIHNSTSNNKTSTSSTTRDVNELLKNNDADSLGVPRFVWNLSQFFVRPLHNYFQQHHHYQKDNADEIQVMLVPTSSRFFSSSSSSSSISSNGNKYRCFIATNSELLTQKHVDEAFQNLKIGQVYKIQMPVTLVASPDEKGRHAEQKLIEYLAKHLLLVKNKDKNKTHKTGNNNNHNVPESEKAIIVGERLPCAACRAFVASSINISKYVMIPKSHGHLYVDKTLPMTPFNTAMIKCAEDLHVVLSKGNKVMKGV